MFPSLLDRILAVTSVLPRGVSYSIVTSSWCKGTSVNEQLIYDSIRDKRYHTLPISNSNQGSSEASIIQSTIQ